MHTWKKCTAHFGHNNNAVFEEKSGTLFCREHKPKKVPFPHVNVDKTQPKKKKAAKVS